MGGNDTAVTIEKLCKKVSCSIRRYENVTMTLFLFIFFSFLFSQALNPIDELKFNWDEPLHTAAVCVYPLRIHDAIKVLQNSDVKHNISVASGKCVLRKTSYFCI